MTQTGNDVKRLLALAKVSREEAARACGCTVASFANKLSLGRFSAQELKTLAELCGATIRICGAGWSFEITEPVLPGMAGREA